MTLFSFHLSLRHDGRHSIGNLAAIKAAKRNPPKVKLTQADIAEERACNEQRWKDLGRRELKKRQEGMFLMPQRLCRA